MTFKKDSVTFQHHVDNAYRVEIRAGDGTTIKRAVAEEELEAFCKMHGFEFADVAEQLASLRK